ncbi:aminotransferase class III-fold pyridoxal phosphate-dependent enzyme [Plantactinospora sp. B6F1]|uniref:aminotransferase class III-fold pyridoxal phosphate-dependent enzyme n=1 Tax=Plantactinospora sp. B6F1 TaxID=3158971 RepID=UPI0032D9829B
MTVRGPATDDLATVLSLGSLAPRCDIAEATRRLADIPAETVLDWLSRHKVVSIAVRRLAQPGIHLPPALADGLARSAEHRRLVNRNLDVELPHLTDLVARSGARAFLIKGMASRACYPEPYDRDIGDFDLWVPDTAEAVALAGELTDAGYRMAEHELPWIKSTRSGHLYGQFLLEREVADGRVAVDVHYGGYSVRHCGLLRLNPGTVGPGLHRLDTLQNMPMLVANAAGDYFMTLKDLNDLYLAVADSGFDWDTVRARVREIGLAGFFNNMLRQLREWFSLTDAQAETVRGLRFRAAWEPAPSRTGWVWNRRWLVTVAHAAATGLRVSPADTVRMTRTAAGYYRHRLTLRLGGASDDRPIRVPDDLNPWTCVRLVPLPSAVRLLAPEHDEDRVVGVSGQVTPLVPGCAALGVVATPAGDAVLLNGGVFLPTVSYALDPALIRTVHELAVNAGAGRVDAGTTGKGEDRGAAPGPGAVQDAAVVGDARVVDDADGGREPGGKAHPAFGVIRRHLSPPLALAQRLVGLGAVEIAASGAEVTLSDGRSAVDFGSYAVPLVGHGHPRVTAAVRSQLETQAITTRTLANPVTTGYVERLVAAVGVADLRRVWLGLNGTDAVEAALKLVRAATGRPRVLAVCGAFHGKTMGSLAATWNDHYRAPVRALLTGVTHIDVDDRSAVAREAAAGDVAALIFEPVQGENGVVVLPPETLRRWTHDAHQAGALVVADEIQTGMGRCGPLSVAIGLGLPIDALLLGKSLGGGVLPLSALIGTDRVYEPLMRDPFLHVATFGGHPLGCAAGTAMLDVVAELAVAGDRLARQVEAELCKLRDNHPTSLVEVRGMGLLWGLKLRTPELAGAVLTTAVQRGLLLSPCLGRPEILRLLPPMTTTADQLERAMAILDEAIGEEE